MARGGKNKWKRRGGGGEWRVVEDVPYYRDEMVRFPFLAFADPVVHAIKTRPHDRRRRGVTRILSGRKRCVEILRSGVNLPIHARENGPCPFPDDTGDSVHRPH